MFRRRETLIALRARREAFQIASEVAHPQLERAVRPVPSDAPPPPPPDTPIYQVRDDTDVSWLVLLGAALLFFAFVLLYVGR